MNDDATEYMIDQLYQSMAVQDAEIKRLQAEIKRLRKWNAEATAVLSGWDLVHEAVEHRPVDLGRSKSDIVLDRIAAKDAEIERLRAALRGERFAHTRLWDWWSDALVERNRLRDGIAEIIGGEWSDMPGPTHPRRRLWALIEDGDQ